MVVAGGHGYIVDPGKQELIETTVDDIDQLIVASPNLLILVRRYSIDARWPRGLLWSSDFFFVELRNVRVEDTRLLGEGRDPLNEWSKFVFDVANGKALAA